MTHATGRGAYLSSPPPMLWYVCPMVAALLARLFWAVVWPFCWLHPKLRPGQLERLALDPPTPALPPARFWLHGASAGDVQALAPLAKALKDQGVGSITLTVVTASGAIMADAHRDAFDHVRYAPYDVPGAVKRAFERIAPTALVLERTELWPQLLLEARRQGVPVFLNNGTISRASIGGYRALFSLTGNLVHMLALMLMRDAENAQNIHALGARPEHVLVAGSTKLDAMPLALPENLRPAAGLTPSDRVVVAGSVRPEELSTVLDAFLRVRRSVPDAKLILAPRYPKMHPIMTALHERQLTWAQRSHGAPKAPYDVFVLDTMGELRRWYGSADVAFVGGTFSSVGGHNVIEAAAAAVPIVLGPRIHGVRDAIDILRGHGLRIADDLAPAIIHWLEHPVEAKRLGQDNRRAVNATRGVAARNAANILTRLNQLRPGAVTVA